MALPHPGGRVPGLPAAAPHPGHTYLGTVEADNTDASIRVLKGILQSPAAHRQLLRSAFSTALFMFAITAPVAVALRNSLLQDPNTTLGKIAAACFCCFVAVFADYIMATWTSETEAANASTNEPRAGAHAPE